MQQRVFAILVVALGLSVAGLPGIGTASAQPQPFYQGKTIRTSWALRREASTTAGLVCLRGTYPNISPETRT
jgi:hypothetical protein